MANDKKISIAVVDDDAEIRTLLQDYLQQNNYAVYVAKNAATLFELLETHPNIDIILLDIMLPEVDGIQLCKMIRQTSQIPIIMLTAVNTDTDRIISLELGADDYVAKPFNPRELVAHIRAVLRRQGEMPSQAFATKQLRSVFEFSGWTLDTATRRLVSPEQVEVALGASAYELLLIFLQHPQRVLSRDQILDLRKNNYSDPFDRTIDIQISRLRQKIEKDPKAPKLIKTIRSGGYMFTSAVKRL